MSGYSQLCHTICMMNAVRMTKGDKSLDYFCMNCGRKVDAMEVLEAREMKMVNEEKRLRKVQD